MPKLHLKAPASVVAHYLQLFVNRRAYTLQSNRPHPQSGRHSGFAVMVRHPPETSLDKVAPPFLSRPVSYQLLLRSGLGLGIFTLGERCPRFATSLGRSRGHLIFTLGRFHPAGFRTLAPS